MNTNIVDNLNAALALLGKGQSATQRSRESCSAIRKVFPVVELIRREGAFDARRKGRTVETAPVLKAQYEELARRVRRHRSACKMCHSFLTRLGTKSRKEIPILLPG